jgi:hypothetical protein
MGVDFSANLSLKGISWHISWYGKLVDAIHDYVWEEEDADDIS